MEAGFPDSSTYELSLWGQRTGEKDKAYQALGLTTLAVSQDRSTNWRFAPGFKRPGLAGGRKSIIKMIKEIVDNW